MAKRRAEETAAELLAKWTDADTAMQIVGTSLGVFGIGRLDPEIVLAKETPLRNALFDVLLSLVEGGALDVRPTDDGHYAFRWRADYAVGALSPESASTVDLEAPSPYLAELAEARRQRDTALERATSAEALVEELEAELDELDPLDDEDLEAAVAAHAAPTVEVEEAAPQSIDLVTLEDEDDEPENGEVVYLTPPASDAQHSVGSKWSPYTLDKSRSQVSSVEGFANEG
jgi:hypothetical protein